MSEAEAEFCSSSKRPKLDQAKESVPKIEQESSKNGSESNNNHFPFQQFQAHRTLFSDPRTKSICVLGGFTNTNQQQDQAQGQRGQGIVIAEKQPLTESSLSHLFSASSPEVRKKFQNDVYSQYVLECKEGGVGEVRVTTVYPATEAHVTKYEAQNCRLVRETPDNYLSITKPFAVKQTLSLDWVYNILEGRSEVERVVYQDLDPEVGFVLVPDLKWDQKALENLYVLAIARQRGVLSLREIRDTHLPMLRNILNRGKKEISAKYKVQEDQLRAYVHYQPSYYHFHIHFTHLRFVAPKSSVGEAHLLEDVIDNVGLDPLFYAKRTLSFVVKESSPLWEGYCNVK